MKAKLLRLKPNSRFHFGKPLIDPNTSLTKSDSYLHSDVLFSALVNNLSTVDGQRVSGFIEGFRKGSIKISSAFYCLEHKQDSFTYFLPAPASISNFTLHSEYENIKKYRKLKFITHALLTTPPEQWVLGHDLAIDEETAKSLGTEVTTGSNSLSLYKKRLNTQVGLRNMKENEDNTEQPAGPYSIEYIEIADCTTFSSGVHFYFLYEIKDAGLKPDFELATQLLQYNGVGGERSSGYGQIEAVCNISELPPYFIRRAEAAQLSLSRIIPHKNELSLFTAYTHSIRGGRHTGEGYLQSVRMIDEGAVLKGEITGHIEDISPSQTTQMYLRNGKAFTLPLPDTLKLMHP